MLGGVGGVFFATDGGGDVHDVAVACAFVFVFDGMDDVGVPEDAVAGLHERDGSEGFE